MTGFRRPDALTF
ncbi:hypothetical protein LINGRAHAP2_LOCUS20445 [Linum grandiflorum]